MKRILLFLAAVILAPVAAAQVSSSDIEVGVDVGVAKFDSEISDDIEALAGLRAGWFLTDAVALELELRQASVPLSGEMQTIMVNAQYNFKPQSTVNTYVYGGIGGANLELNPLFGAAVDDTSLALGAGGGVRIFFGSNTGWALRLQAGAITEETFDERSTSSMFTGGVSYRFSR